MSGVEIRLARIEEREALIALQRQASLAGSPPEFVAELLARPELIDLDAEWIGAGQVFVAERGSRIIGFAVIVPHEGNDAELDGIFVSPDAWRQGVGTLLMRQIEREAAAWGATRLHVAVNPFATAFYTHNGFRPTGTRKVLIGPPVTVMSKPVRLHG